jgi:hypothetical protein
MTESLGNNGTRGRTWTGTALRPGDFKSRLIIHKNNDLPSIFRIPQH